MLVQKTKKQKNLKHLCLYRGKIYKKIKIKIPSIYACTEQKRKRIRKNLQKIPSIYDIILNTLKKYLRYFFHPTL